jgi:site-specific DNA recombinase
VERPDGRRLVEDARDRKFDSILVRDTKRLGRTLKVTLEAEELITRAGVALKSGTEMIDTSTSHGRLVFQIMGGFAEYDRSETVEKLALARNRKQRMDCWTTGPVPMGYALDAEGCPVPNDTPIEGLGATEAEVARSVFERIAAGGSSVAEARRLNALGVPTAAAASSWSSSSPTSATRRRRQSSAATPPECSAAEAPWAGSR